MDELPPIRYTLAGEIDFAYQVVGDGPTTPGEMATVQDAPSVAWFRRDLRLADNPAWDTATAAHRSVVACFVWEPAPTGPAGDSTAPATRTTKTVNTDSRRLMTAERTASRSTAVVAQDPQRRPALHRAENECEHLGGLPFQFRRAVGVAPLQSAEFGCGDLEVIGALTGC
jgi:hypothetical protein